MTTIETTTPRQVAVSDRQRGAANSRQRRGAIPLIAVALAASLAGGAVGAAAAVAAPGLTRDPAAEQARWLEFVEQLEEAIRLDDLWQQQHPEPR